MSNVWEKIRENENFLFNPILRALFHAGIFSELPGATQSDPRPRAAMEEAGGAMLVEAESFCSSPLWNTSLTWHTDRPQVKPNPEA
jgi:hypothetical protein